MGNALLIGQVNIDDPLKNIPDKTTIIDTDSLIISEQNETTKKITFANLKSIFTGLFAPLSHVGTRGSSHLIATTSSAGFMSSADKTKLDGVATGADKTTIANNLTTTVAGSALDATQGKLLNDSLNTKVPNTRKINGKTLDADITLTSSDFNVAPPTDSYMAFCANVNTNSIDAAFGKGNEDVISGLGSQLAMYSWFSGENKTTYPFTNLIKKNTYSDILNDPLSKSEVQSSLSLCNLIQLSPYARQFTYDKLILVGGTVTAMYYDGTKFILGTNAGKIFTTTDFITYTPPSTVVANKTICDISYGKGVYVVVVDSATANYAAIYRSTDLTTWTPSGSSFIGGTSTGMPTNLYFFNNRFYVIGGYSTSGTFKYSNDGINWLDATITGSPSAYPITFMAYNGTKFVVFYGNIATTQTLISTDGITFAVTPVTGLASVQFRSIVVDNDNNFIATEIGTSAKTYISSDGVNYTALPGATIGSTGTIPTVRVSAYVYPFVISMSRNGVLTISTKSGDTFAQSILVNPDTTFGYSGKMIYVGGYLYIVSFNAVVYRIKLALI